MLYRAGVFALLWLVGQLPLKVAHALARGLALAMRIIGTREVRVARVNFALCFPRASARQREVMLRACLWHTACTLLETCRLWTRPPGAGLHLIREVVGGELLDAAAAAGRGVVVAAPHLGNWELLSQFLASRGRLSIVYRVPQVTALEPLLIAGRGGAAVEQLRADRSSVRRMLKVLRAGRMLGVLPDQRPKIGEGEFASLFGEPALTMTLLPRLTRSAGAAVLFGFAERLAGARGFRIHILPAPAGIDDPDPKRGVAALNAGIEACVALAPMQYQWTYKRYSLRPAGAGPNPYQRSGHVLGHAASRPGDRPEELEDD